MSLGVLAPALLKRMGNMGVGSNVSTKLIAKLGAIRATGQATGVTATADGLGKLVDLQYEDFVLQNADKEAVQELTKEAVNAAFAEAEKQRAGPQEEAMQDMMQELMGGGLASAFAGAAKGGAGGGGGGNPFSSVLPGMLGGKGGDK